MFFCFCNPASMTSGTAGLTLNSHELNTCLLLPGGSTKQSVLQNLKNGPSDVSFIFFTVARVYITF